MRKTTTLLATVVLVSTLVNGASATVLTYEGFNYTSGAGLSGKNGGSGWRPISAWDAGTVASSGLSYTAAGYAAPSLTNLPTTGLASTFTGAQGVRFIAIDAGDVYDTAGYRDGGNRLGASGNAGQGNINKTLYGSVLVSSSDWSAARMIFSIEDNGGSNLRLDQGSNGGNLRIMDASASTKSSTSPTALTGTNTYLLAWQMDFSSAANGDNLTFWVNPTDSTTPPTGGISLTTTQNLTVNSLRLRSVAGTVLFDEVRVGTAWSDVAPGVVPEPTSLALLGLGSLFALRRRRAL